MNYGNLSEVLLQSYGIFYQIFWKSYHIMDVLWIMDYVFGKILCRPVGGLMEGLMEGLVVFLGDDQETDDDLMVVTLKPNPNSTPYP